MKLMDFPCGRRAVLPEEAAPSRTRTPDAGSYRVEQKRQSRASPWRPSLVAISEDVALVVGRDGAASAKASGGPRKSIAKSASRVGPRPIKGDAYGYYGVPAVVPAFAPAAFIF